MLPFPLNEKIDIESQNNYDNGDSVLMIKHIKIGQEEIF